MEKERLGAFTDAILAIIMTILVLELERPEEITVQAFWDLRAAFFSYALSFFWLSAMWVNLHMEWHAVRKVDNRIVWHTMAMLFFASLFPYVTSMVDSNFYNVTAQVSYGLIVFAVTITNTIMYNSLLKADPSNTTLQFRMQRRRKWATIDIAIKCIGLVLTLLIFPPAMMLSVLATLVCIVIPTQLKSNHTSINSKEIS